MPLKNKSRRIKKGLILLIVCCLSITFYLLYYQLWYKSEHVDSKIFRLASVLAAHKSDVWSVEFSPDGRFLASGGVDSTVKIWDKETGFILLNLKQPSGVTDLSFSPDGKYIAVASYDEKVRLWKFPEGIMLKEFTGHKGTVWSVSFSPNGKTFASSGQDATIKLWDVESGGRIRTLQGHTLNVWDVKFSPDGTTIASGSFDHTIKIWDASGGENIRTLTGHSQAIVALAFSHNGKILASTSDDRSIKLWNTSDWSLRKTLTVAEHTQAADFSPDDKMLLTAGRDKPMIGEFLQNFFGDSKLNKGVSMRLWDMYTYKLLQTFSEHANDVNDVSFSPDGKWIASASSDKTIELWKLSR